MITPRQAVARLGMRRRDMQLSRIVAAEDVRQATDVIGVVENAFRHHQQLFAGFGHAQQPLAAANEYFNAQLFFQLANMPADAGLRSK